MTDNGAASGEDFKGPDCCMKGSFVGAFVDIKKIDKSVLKEAISFKGRAIGDEADMKKVDPGDLSHAFLLFHWSSSDLYRRF